MIPGKHLASISISLISEELKYYEIATVTASNQWPWANVAEYKQMWNWMVESLSKLSGHGIKMDSSFNLGAKSMILFNILRAIAP